MNKAMLFETKKINELISALNAGGYDCEEAEGGVKVFVVAQAYQEFKLLVEEVLEIARKFNAQFLGYAG